MFRSAIAALLLLVAGATAEASLNVVATGTNMGMLAREVGGDAVSVRVLAPPDRDAHHLQVRPAMMAALRRADLVVAVGAELEIGWLPPAIQGAANPRVNPGAPGYFEAAAQVPLIDAHGIADRSLGDVHPHGNPHVYLDPVRMGEVARALAERLARLDPANAARFDANAAAFGQAVEARMPAWRARARNAAGVVLYHKDADYLMERLDIPVLAYVEPAPGIPAGAAHLRGLVTRLKGQSGVVLHAVFNPEQGPAFVGRALGWPVAGLPTGVPLNAMTVDAYLDMIDAWVNAAAGA
jgi:zinc/manganese transport system substrate-binding protein